MTGDGQAMDCTHCVRSRKQLVLVAGYSVPIEAGRYPDDEIRECPCPCHDTWRRWVDR